MYNQKYIEDVDFIKGIEEQGEFLCNNVEHCDHKSKDVFYYHYKGRVYKVVTTKPFTAGKLESIREGIISGMIETCRANNIDFREEDYRKKFNEDYKNSDESVVLDCTEENLLSISSEVLYEVAKYDLLEKDLEKKIILLNQLSTRLKMDDVINNKTSVLLNSESIIDGACLTSRLNISEIKFDNDNLISFEACNTSGGNIYAEIEGEKVGIAHEVIDEYREVYRIFSCHEKNNYFDIKILFINNERKGYMYGVLNKDSSNM